MSVFKSFFEWYLGVPPSDPGQGTAWNYQWRSPWPDGLPSWSLVILIGLLIAYVVLIYSRDAGHLPRRTRWGLTALRLLIVAMVLFFLTEFKLSVDYTF